MTKANIPGAGKLDGSSPVITNQTIDGRSDMTNWEMDLFDTRMSYLNKVFLPLFHETDREQWERTGVCLDTCRLELLESIPENLTFGGGLKHRSTYEGWMELLRSAESSVDLTAFYWTLDGDDVYSDITDWQGGNILKEIAATGKRGVKVRIAQNAQKVGSATGKESLALASQGLALVRSLNMTRWFGSGVVHTKLWIVDEKHLYIGSANMDWRSLTQVKEMGVLVQNCACVAKDATKIFEIYWSMGAPKARIPEKWSELYNTRFNAKTPLTISINGSNSKGYISSSPPGFSPPGRENDSAAIVNVIARARSFVHIAVMDYAPTTEFTRQKKFWPVIDDAIRAAAFERGVRVKLLMSKWRHTKRPMYAYLRSLSDFSAALTNNGSIQVMLFTVPSYNKRQEKIPFARVNHNKYMVTDKTAYIGTSNWEADYFLTTAGVALVVDSAPLVEQLNGVFMRDWNSSFATPLDDFDL